jgi:hypothetical protein
MGLLPDLFALEQPYPEPQRGRHAALLVDRYFDELLRSETTAPAQTDLAPYLWFDALERIRAELAAEKEADMPEWGNPADDAFSTDD